MNKIKLILFLSFILFSACTSIGSSDTKNFENVPPSYLQTEIPFTPFPTVSSISHQPVQLAWFYKPPQDGALNVLAEQFDFFILTHKDEKEKQTLIDLGVDVPIYQYLLFVQIMDPGSCIELPYGNQVAYKAGDFCRILADHPDWFLRDENGNIIRRGLNAYMDAGNEEYLAFWLERAKEMQNLFGWEAIFIDNVEASLDKLKRMGVKLEKYKDDEAYQNEVEGFLKYLHENYFEPENKSVFANIIELRENAVWFRYMQYLDGAMLESFAVDYNNRYISPNSWKNQMDLAVETQALGKKVVLIAQGQKEDFSRFNFSFASYLLINDGRAYFRYADSDVYDQIWLYDTYAIELGLPIAPAYRDGILWKRDFENGTVQVNPLLFSADIVLKP